MATDGNYCTLNFLKQFQGEQQASTLNPTTYNNGVLTTPDDNVLSNAIINAEAAFEQETGCAFWQQTFTNVQSFLTYVDRAGWLHLFAREVVPVTSVSAVQFRDIAAGDTLWTSLTWSTDDIILPPYSAGDTKIRPESAHVKVYTGTAGPLLPHSTGTILARWTYTGGFPPTVPQSLTMLIAEAANYIYRLREAPMGQVMNQPLGTMTVPANLPPYIRKQFSLWSPKYS